MEQHIKEKLKQIIEDLTINDVEKQIAIHSVLKKIQVDSSFEKPMSITEAGQSNFNLWDAPNFQTITLDTGWESLNNEIGYVGKGEMIVFAGRPGMGKTRWLVQMALSISKKKKILFHSLELSTFSITNYFISTLTQISLRKLMSFDLSEKEKNSIKESIKELKNYQLVFSSESITSFDSVLDFYSKLIDEDGIEVICIDYLQLISNQSHSKSREFEIALFLRNLKSLAREKDIIFLITSQLNRSLELRGGDKRPILSDLRESGSIEEFADKVVFIYRPEYYQFTYNEDGESTVGMIELIIAKNNNGKAGTVSLYSNENFTRFLENLT
jgi:replicative DNA helicase